MSSKQQPANNEVITTVHTFKVGTKKRFDTSRQMEDDYNYSLDIAPKESKIIPTPYSVDFLKKLHETSNVLPQCISAYVTNIALYGFRVVPINTDAEIDQQEYDLLKSLIQDANVDESLAGVQAKRVKDYEQYGFSFLEILRNRKGEVSSLRQAQAYRIRIMSASGREIKVSRKIKRGNKTVTISEYKRFKKYVQEINGKKIYFKEFGDPRIMDYRTGQYQKEKPANKDERIPDRYRATEILHMKQYSEDVYGIPRWLSQLPSILGSREAEEVNLRYFEDNMIPATLLTVSGGRLTRQSFLELKDAIENGGIGKDRQNSFMLIEAVSESEGLDDRASNVQVKIEKLSDARPSDALFADYDKANISKVRSSFRLPPGLIGLSQDVTFATANVSAFIAETQVFVPERTIHDEFLNKRLINSDYGFGLKTVKLESKGPSITNPEQIVKAMTALNVMGGVTPRQAVDVFNEALQLSLMQYPEEGEEGYEPWMDKPVAFELKSVTKNTDLEQSQKDQDIKDIEDEGEVGAQQPEHGQE